MSKLERTMSLHLKAVGISAEPEYRFHHKRRWRFDFAIPERKVAIECEGGIWTGGRHTRGAGFENDCEKYNAAAELGWCVLRFTKRMIESGEAIKQVERALRMNTPDALRAVGAI